MFFRSALAIGLLFLSVQGQAADLRLLSHFVVDLPYDEFSGLSGVTMSEDGSSARILNDRNRVFLVGLPRNDQGNITNVNVISSQYLYLYESDIHVDTEGLAQAPGGGLYVSVEFPLTVLHYPPNQSWPDTVLNFPELRIRNDNRGLEALAIDDLGRLITLPETVPRQDTGFPIYRLEEDVWTRIATLPHDGGFNVAGADFGPDGKLYILERAVSLLGFRTRVRRLSAPLNTAQAETLITTYVSQFDNLEGLSVWRDPTGEIRLTFVSDDNSLPVQRTEIVEFALNE